MKLQRALEVLEANIVTALGEKRRGLELSSETALLWGLTDRLARAFDARPAKVAGNAFLPKTATIQSTPVAMVILQEMASRFYRLEGWSVVHKRYPNRLHPDYHTVRETVERIRERIGALPHKQRRELHRRQLLQIYSRGIMVMQKYQYLSALTLDGAVGELGVDGLSNIHLELLAQTQYLLGKPSRDTDALYDKLIARYKDNPVEQARVRFSQAVGIGIRSEQDFRR